MIYKYLLEIKYRIFFFDRLKFYDDKLLLLQRNFIAYFYKV